MIEVLEFFVLEDINAREAAAFIKKARKDEKLEIQNLAEETIEAAELAQSCEKVSGDGVHHCPLTVSRNADDWGKRCVVEPEMDRGREETQNMASYGWRCKRPIKTKVMLDKGDSALYTLL